MNGDISSSPRRETRLAAGLQEVADGSWSPGPVLVVSLCGFLAFQAPDVLSSLARLDVATRILALTAIGLLILHFWAAAVMRPIRMRLAILATQALVTYFPLLLHVASIQYYYYPMAGWLAGSVLLTLPGMRAWLISGLIASGTGVEAWALSPGKVNVTSLELKTLGIALIIYAFFQLSIIARQARADGDDIAQLAVIKERMRIARDLHDLLGYSLSAIILKAELAGRLLASRPDQAREETGEVIRMARQALDDVRLVSRGYRHITLAKEAESATGILAAAGINAEVEVTCGPLNADVDAALAIVLREGLNNVLRHSNSKSCTVTADRSDGTIRLRITNDGVLRAAHDRGNRSSHGGLTNLTMRLREVGGHLTTRTTADSSFELIAEVPAPIPAAQAHQHATDRYVT